MCLGIPGRVESIQGGDLRLGRVAFGGIIKEVCLVYVPDARVGQYVIVHAGFAISVLDEEEAARVFETLEQLGDLSVLGPSSGDAETESTVAVDTKRSIGEAGR